MTTLLSTIRADALSARKQRDAIASSLLTTLLSEAERPGLDAGKRESSDAEVLAVVRKFLKNIGETLAVRGNDEVLLREKQILESYLPSQMSEEQLRVAIVGIRIDLGLDTLDKKSVGLVMKELNARLPAGSFSGATASALVRQMASG